MLLLPQELIALVEHVRALAAGDSSLVAKLIVTGRSQGGHYRAKEVRDAEVKDALLDYLTAADQFHALKTDAPLWTRHDNPKLVGEQLTSHAFVRNLKLYARASGIGDIHLHQTRHTFARMVSVETGSISATQDALDHRNRATTSHYVQRISIKRDLYSEGIAEKLKRKTGNKRAA